MPSLSGHERSYKEFALSKRRDWRRDAENAYCTLSEKCDEITVVGFSMGGLLAVQLYQTHPFHKLVTVNTPVYYWNVSQIFRNLRSDWRENFSRYFHASAKMPLRALWQFQRLLSETKPLFKNVRCDALVIQTQDDDTVKGKSADYIHRGLGGSKRLLRPALGGHVLFQSEHYADVLTEIKDFISGI
jgi:carboxylesterase